MEVKLWAGEPHQGTSFVASLEEEWPAHLVEELDVTASGSESHESYGEGDCVCQSSAAQATQSQPQAALASRLLPAQATAIYVA